MTSLTGALPVLVSTSFAQQSTLPRALPFTSLGKSVHQAPFGGDVSRAIDNYNRVAPYIANAGLLHEGGLQEVQTLGFKLVVDLRGSDEKGVTSEKQLARSLGIDYYHLPVTSRAPSSNQVEELASLLHDTENYPILIHCVSSNRSGAIWAMYRASVGVDAMTAIEEGRAAGLTSRESAVRKALNRL